MSLPVTASLLAEDVSLIEASEFWQRQRLDIVQTSVGKVFVKAQRKGWHPFRYNLLNAIAFLVRMPMIKAASAPGGQAAQAMEVRRLQSLRDAGVQVPAVLHAAPQWFAMQFVDAPNLLDCMQREQPQLERLNSWLQGAEGIGHVHRNGQALSQAFARNCLLHERQIWFIDFEDDPTQVMSLSHAQARDWLAYLHSTVWALRQCGVSWEEML